MHLDFGKFIDIILEKYYCNNRIQFCSMYSSVILQNVLINTADKCITRQY